ncbi:MAG: ABC transporter ATP-binding protein [Desulfurococcales archaeon]|nr:ABC transporter ATP-binding protein [Desulfurococcales archaeon]
MPRTTVLSVENIWKYYGRTPALRGVSFSVREGELVGLVGPNGSGKTTLIRIIVGILRASRGRVSLRGSDPFREPRSREGLGYIPERPVLPSSMSIRELLRTAAMIYSHPRPSDAAEEALAIAGLEGHGDKSFDELSAGLKQRAAIAHALVHEPEIIVADEPTSNLDPVERLKILELLADLNTRRGLTLLFTSHVLAEVSRLSERIVVLLRGERVFYGSPRSLVERSRLVRVRTSEPRRLAYALSKLGYSVGEEAFSVLIRLGSRSELGKLLRDLSEIAGEVPIFSIDTVEAALEELLRGGAG